MERDTGLAILVPFARSPGEPISCISASSGRARGARAAGFVARRLLDIFSKFAALRRPSFKNREHSLTRTVDSMRGASTVESDGIGK
jgi:hypothetical protein